ncbi:MAG: RHS repeat domain-containing protein, partial [Thermoanaerobaculia bacterium]
MWSEIPHLNGVSDLQEIDPSGIARTYSLSAEDSCGSLWDWGPFTYDGSGNIHEIGSETYVYDEVSRLVSGTASGYTEDYTYDPFGNLTAVAASAPGGPAQNRVISVSLATNRLTTARCATITSTISAPRDGSPTRPAISSTSTTICLMAKRS